MPNDLTMNTNMFYYYHWKTFGLFLFAIKTLSTVHGSSNQSCWNKLDQHISTAQYIGNKRSCLFENYSGLIKKNAFLGLLIQVLKLNFLPSIYERATSTISIFAV
jgi:hypothetical protein